MKELDLLLERFGRRAFAQATPPERRAFEALLELPDPVLAGYLLGGVTPPDPASADLVRQIRAYVA
jgi:succinate dehydrogenase flavin-adding protein (antitoxin of CptAB toxin-antitoxin module)